MAISNSLVIFPILIRNEKEIILGHFATVFEGTRNFFPTTRVHLSPGLQLDQRLTGRRRKTAQGDGGSLWCSGAVLTLGPRSGSVRPAVSETFSLQQTTHFNNTPRDNPTVTTGSSRVSCSAGQHAHSLVFVKVSTQHHATCLPGESDFRLATETFAQTWPVSPTPTQKATSSKFWICCWFHIPTHSVQTVSSGPLSPEHRSTKISLGKVFFLDPLSSWELRTWCRRTAASRARITGAAFILCAAGENNAALVSARFFSGPRRCVVGTTLDLIRFQID